MFTPPPHWQRHALRARKTCTERARSVPVAVARRGNAHGSQLDEAAKPHELLRRHHAALLLQRPWLSCVQTAHTEQKADVSP